MRKIFSILLCAALIFTLCSCRKNRNEDLNSSGFASAESLDLAVDSEIINSESASENNQTEKEMGKDESSKVESNGQSEEELGKVNSKKEESVAESSKESSKVSSTKSESSVSAPVENPAPQTNTQTPVLGFTINDPDNLRELSTERVVFSFGVASNGVPHNQSVVNQNIFDGFENVSALALDNKTAEKVMYLTFDNGYEYENITASILDTLKAKGIKAAFFVTMSYAKENPQLVRRMIDEGHIVGNHSTTHPSFPKLTRTQMAEEIAGLNDYLVNNFSYSSPYFRFPAGEYSECALELVTSIGFRSVFWSVAYADWDTKAQKGEEYAYTTVTSRFHSGAVILLHAVSRDNAQALGRIIDNAVAQGYTFKTLDEYFNR